MINPVSFESVYRSAYSQNAYQASKISHLPAAQKSVPASDKICISTVGSLQQTAAKAAAAVGSIPLHPLSGLVRCASRYRTGLIKFLQRMLQPACSAAAFHRRHKGWM